MHFVYLIQGKQKYRYIGNTYDLKKRLIEHNNGYNPSTKQYVPYELIYFEAYKNKQDAIDREYKLKHYGSSIGHLKKRLERSLKM